MGSQKLSCLPIKNLSAEEKRTQSLAVASMGIPHQQGGAGLCATTGSAVSPVHMLASPSISPTKQFFFNPPTHFAGTKILGSSVCSPSSLPLDFFLPVLLRRLNVPHCISLRGSTWWFNLHLLWNGYHNKVSKHTSFHTNMIKKKGEKEYRVLLVMRIQHLLS